MSNNKNINNFIFKQLDIFFGIIISLIGLIILYVGIKTGFSSTSEMAIVALFSSIIYLLFRNRFVKPNKFDTFYLPFHFKSLTFLILLVIAFSFIIIKSNVFRPPIYFILISCAIPAIALQIISSYRNTHTIVIIFEILLLSLNLRFGLYYEVPGLLGVDAWQHLTTMNTWLNAGRITFEIPLLKEGFSYYSDFPFMHLRVISTKLIGALNLKDSLFVSIECPIIFGLIFMYQLGKRFSNRNTGLLAILYLCVCPTHIFWSAMIIPTSMGMFLFSVILFLVLSRHLMYRVNLLLIILLSTLIFTHTLSSFVILISLSTILFSQNAYNFLFKAKKTNNLNLITIFFFFIFTITKWSRAMGNYKDSIFTIFTSWLFSSLITDIKIVGQIISLPSESFLVRFWYVASIGFLVFGSIVWMNHFQINSQKFSVVISTFTLILVMVVPSLLNINNLLPSRWLPFIFIIGVFPITQGFISLFLLIKRKNLSISIMMICLFIFSFLALNTGSINFYSPFLNQPNREGFILTELSAANTLNQLYEGRIITDPDFASLIFYSQLNHINVTYHDPRINQKGIIVMRKDIVLNKKLQSSLLSPEVLTDKRILQFFYQFENTNHYNSIYCNAEVTAYIGR